MVQSVEFDDEIWRECNLLEQESDVRMDVRKIKVYM